MGTTEARNVAAFERYTDELFNNKRIELVDELIAPSYTRHSQRGVTVDTPDSYAPTIKALAERFTIDDLIAREDRIAVRYHFDQLDDDELLGTAIAIYRFEADKVAEHWVAWRSAEVGPWDGDVVPRDQWSIAGTDLPTPDEEANLTTLARWGDIRHNRSDDFEGLRGLVTDPYTLHSPTSTRSISADDVVRISNGFANRFPGFTAHYDDMFIARDRVAVRFCYRFADGSPPPHTQCALAIYRFEGNRIAEYWQTQLPDDVDWD
ncbi:MAG: SnoaL-like domain-containing protein [Dehalococcoidia bacterium]|jgi:predicted SnoaL-like aldol condensation-catalyzing enzyme|nr:SnoaL-like domain-containing protein [Dehalococcoidia bacterium]